MKNLKVWLVFLPLFTIACSEEYAGEITESGNAADLVNKSDSGSANASNPLNRDRSATNEIVETANEVNIQAKRSEDSQITQTTTAIVEYAVAETEEDRRKDKDWETSVTKIAPKGTKESIGLGLNAATVKEVSKN